MASAHLREELICSICLETFSDPVMLKCGHNFCRVCIDRVMDTQERSGVYFCPVCRKRFRSPPALQRNITLRNIVENILSAQPGQEGSGVLCTYCVDFPSLAVRSCLHCEVSLCETHLNVHKKSPEHVLCDPSVSLESRRCSIHKKILEYYCTEDDTCVCTSCFMIGGHKGHEMESLDEASKKKTNKVRKDLQKLQTKREEMEERVQRLQEHKRRVEEKAADDTERVSALYKDLRRHLEDQENRVLSEISRPAERVTRSILDKIRELEIKKDKLSRKMRHIEEMCHMTDPLTFLQEPDSGDLCDTEDGGNERHEELLHDGGDLDVTGILQMLSGVIRGTNIYFYIQGAADISLDINTAANKLYISDDRKMLSWSKSGQNYPETPERFQIYAQVLSSQRFSSGRHYWDVDVGGSDFWRVGVCYPSIDRRGEQAGIGGNSKSWGLLRSKVWSSVRHDKVETFLPSMASSNRVRIYLDYESGQISFYDLCDPIRHLHTFIVTFTEPLHAAFYVAGRSIKIC